MALIVEDGTNVANANSYAPEVSIIAYAASRGVTMPNDAALLVNVTKAMDYIELQDYADEPTYDDQALAFPRGGEVTIPAGIVKTLCQLTIDVFNGIDLMPSRAAEQAIKREKIGGTSGAIETEYFGPTPFAPDIPIATALLRPFLSVGSFGVTVIRA